MPIYEYKCTGCGHEFELYRTSYKERDDVGLCCHCDEVVKRKVSDCSFQLKGLGWEKDGYCKTTGKLNYKSEVQRESNE